MAETSSTKRRPGYKRRGIRGGFDYLDMVTIHHCMAMGPENARAFLEECNEMAAAAERKMVDEKVNSWRESLVPATANDTDQWLL